MCLATDGKELGKAPAPTMQTLTLALGFNGSTHHRCTASEDLPVGYCGEQLWAASRE